MPTDDLPPVRQYFPRRSPSSLRWEIWWRWPDRPGAWRAAPGVALWRYWTARRIALDLQTAYLDGRWDGAYAALPVELEPALPQAGSFHA